MNMGFRRPDGIEVPFSHYDLPPVPVERDEEDHYSLHTSRRAKLLWLLAGVTGAYVLTTVSYTAVAVIAGIVLALIGIATAVCISSQNITRF